MNIEVFFHDCFTTSNEYKKVIISIEKNGKYYLFGAICNKQTNKIEVQRFAERDEQSAKFLIHGRKGCAKKYQDMTANELQIFKDCIYALPRAMHRFYQLNMPFDDVEKNEIRDVVCAIDLNGVNNVETSVSDVAQTLSNWITADLIHFSAKEISEITKLISISANNPDGVTYNNKKYRLIEENNRYVLQEQACNVDNSEPIAEFIADDNSVNSNVRNFISMAKIVNAENLADIVNGNFYPILNEQDVNGKKYFIIDVNGNQKAIVSNRVKKINVFTEIP
jgi:hypothetical protein